ncbi:MAG: hypothetical protein ACOVLD_02635 [Bacteroidia bacterium]
MWITSLNKTDSSNDFGPKFTLKVVDNLFYQVEFAEDVDFEISDMQDLIEAEKELGGKKLPVLVLCEPTTNTNVELMNYISRNKNNPYSAADAFVISSISQSILANFYSKINRPERPTKFFTKREEALEWLKQFFKAS